MSEYETLLPPGVASTDVAIENGIALDDSKEEIEHNFTVYFIIPRTTAYGEKILATFIFGL